MARVIELGEKVERAHEIASKAREFEKQLSRNLVDRGNEADLLTLALLLGRNAVLIGSAGTAKSEITNKVSKLIDGSVFSIQLSRDTETSEVLGYFDPKVFKDEGKLIRLTDGTLLTADVAVFDEVFEANSILLNALRSAINEKKFYDHGTAYDIPLWSLIGSSNLVPEDPRLAALYDRFLFRGFVQPVGALGKTVELLRAGRSIDLERTNGVNTKPEITVADFKEFRRLVDQVADSVLPLVLPDGTAGEVTSKLVEAFVNLRIAGVELSDRRKVMAQKAVIAAALLDGKSEASMEDLRVLRYLAPETEEQVGDVDSVLRQIIPTDRMTTMDLQVAADSIKRILEPGMPVTEDILEHISEGIETFRTYSASREVSEDVRSFAGTQLRDIESLIRESGKPEFAELKNKYDLTEVQRQ